MSLQFNENLNAISGSDDLEIQLLDGDLNIIAKLDDEPNDVGGLTSAELKAKFDEAGNTIQKYINETLIPAVVADDATEAARAAAEQGRVTAEEGRVTAEQGRVEAENTRVSSETARESAESTRADNETARADAESKRANAESGRVTAEQSRASAEEQRATNEGNRQTSEQGRVEAEQARQAAEETRQTNETARQQGYTAMNQTVAKVGTDMAQFKVWETYSASKSYVPLNKVTYNGSSYICISAVEGVAPPNETYWQLIAAKGTDGEGAGDMLQADYDADGAVKDAGGIKEYADTKLALTGGTVTGDIVLDGKLYNQNQNALVSLAGTGSAGIAALQSKKSDNQNLVTFAASSQGGAPYGKIDVFDGNNHNLLQLTSTKTMIHNVVTPVNAGDAAPKSYVDNGLKDRSKAVRGTYPAAAGQSIAVGDVVDVVNGEVVKKVRAENVVPTLLSNYNATCCVLRSDLGVSMSVSSSTGHYTINLFRITDSIKPVSVIATQEFSDSSYAAQPFGIVALDSIRFVVVARSNQQYFAWVCTVSGTTITAGAAVVLNVGGDSSGRDTLKLIRFSNTSVLVVFGLYNANGLPVQHLSISGTTITPGTIQNLMPGSDIGGDIISNLDARLISGRKVFVAATNSANRLFCAIVNVDEAGTASFGATQLMESVDCYPFCCVNGTDAFVGYINSNVFYGYACSISGNTISAGAKTQLLASVPSYTREVFTFNGEMLIAFASSVFPIQIDNLAVSLGTQMKVAVFNGVPEFGTQLDNERVFLFGSRSYDYFATALKFNNGQIAGRWVTSSKDAIALTAASGGQNCDVLFEGVADASGLTVGANITSDGVQGYVPQTGVLSAFPWWDYQRVATVTGTYVGDDAETQNIDLGFQPRAVLVVQSGGVTASWSGSWPSTYGGLALPGKPVTTGGNTALELTDTGFAVHKPSGSSYTRTNLSAETYYYIAFR